MEGQVRRFVEVDGQGKRTLHSTEVLKEALPEIVEVGTKELPNTGATRDASLVALGLLGVMSGYGLLSRKGREN